MADDRFRIEPLAAHHDRAAFSCGEEALDRYLRHYARQNVEQRVAAVFVMVEAASSRIAGYYTLSAGSVDLSNFPADATKRLPRYSEVPVVLLGRLAVSMLDQGKGLGAVLLFNALRRASAQTAQIGAFAVIVDAKSDRARTFYERHGFHRFSTGSDRLFIPMKTIASVLAAPPQ